MSTTLNATVSSSVKWTHKSSIDLGGTPTDDSSLAASQSYVSTASDGAKASKKYEKLVDIAPAGGNIAVSFSSLVDAFGNTQNMTKLKCMHVEAVVGAGQVLVADPLASDWVPVDGEGAIVSPLYFSLTAPEQFHRNRTSNAGFNSSTATLTFVNTSNTTNFSCKLVLIGD